MVDTPSVIHIDLIGFVGTIRLMATTSLLCLLDGAGQMYMKKELPWIENPKQLLGLNMYFQKEAEFTFWGQESFLPPMGLWYKSGEENRKFFKGLKNEQDYLQFFSMSVMINLSIQL